MLPVIAAAAAQTALDYYSTKSANSASSKASSNSAWLNFAMQNYFMDKQNEYNKPINQMKRLEEAGLNPNLVYGNGNAIMASASPSGGGVDTAGVRSMDKLNILGAMQALRNQKLEEKEINARIDNNRVNSDLAQANFALQSRREDFRQAYDLEKLNLLAQSLGINQGRLEVSQKQAENNAKSFWRKAYDDLYSIGENIGYRIGRFYYE